MKLKLKLYYVTIIFLITLVAVFSWLPVYIEKSRNRISSSQIKTISENLKNFHQSLFIADLHSDSLLWNRNLAKKADYGHVDIPRLIEGNIGLQVFSVVTKTPRNLNLHRNSDDTDDITLLAIAQLWPPKTWTSLYARTNHQAEKLQRIAKNPVNNFYLIKSKQDFQEYLHKRESNPRITAGLLSLEGAHALEGKLENLDHLYGVGFRIIGFTHFFDNALGGSTHGLKKGGITEFGKQVVQRMDELQMFIDISHASPKLISDIFRLSKRPILVTHVGVQAICKSDSNRNLTDQQIRQVANSGGLIGIGFWPTVTCGNSINGIVNSIRYVANLVGIEYVALGSDFDGNTQVPFTSASIVQLTHALIEAGFNEQQIKKIMGENVKRIFLKHLPNK